MKKNLNKVLALMLGLITLGFASCESDMDNNPIFQKPTKFVLNTPDGVNGLYDLRNTETVRFTCSQPDYGYAAAATYTVEVSDNKDFTGEGKVQTLPVASSKCVIDVDATDLAIALCTLYGVADETSPVLSDPVKAYVRIKSTLPLVGEESTIVSNVVELPNVLIFYALPDLELPENLYLIGQFCGWDWGKCAKMVAVNGKDNMWWAVRYVGGAGEGVKFNTSKEWNGDEFGYAAVVPGKTVCGNFVDDGGNLAVEKPGWYVIAVEVSIEGRSYVYTVNMFEPNVYLYGNTTGGVWNNDDNWKFTAPTTIDGVFVSPALAADGEVRMCVNPGWGADWWGLEFTLKDGSAIYYRENDNIADNWENDKGGEYSVKGVPGAVITLDFNNESGSVALP